MPLPSLFTIDPGAPFGWAFWGRSSPADGVPEAGVFQPWDVDGSDVRKWLAKSEQAAREVDLLLRQFSPEKVACEMPWMSETSPTSMAAHKAGSIAKLSMNIGRIMEICRARRVVFVPIRVIDWMGQLQERHVIDRVHRRIPDLTGDFLGEVRVSDQIHAYDAVGIGLYVRTGRF